MCSSMNRLLDRFSETLFSVEHLKKSRLVSCHRSRLGAAPTRAPFYRRHFPQPALTAMKSSRGKERCCGSVSTITGPVRYASMGKA